MKKTLLQQGAAMLLMSTFIMPIAVFAESDNNSGRSDTAARMSRESERSRGESERGGILKMFKKEKSGTDFCKNIDQKSGNINQKFDEHEKNILARREDHAEKLVSKRSDRDMKRSETRDGWDTKREDKFKEFGIKATTDAEKAALAVFKTAVDTAVTARRTAIDTAVTEFRTGMDALNTTRKTSVDAARTAMDTARDTILAKAKTDCTAGVDSKTVKTTFDAAMDALRAQYPAPVKPAVDPAMKTAVEALITKRKTAVETARTTFKTTMEAARAELAKVIPLKK